MTWGPFVPDLDPTERKARLRSLRALVKVMTGPRGETAALAILRAEIAGDDAAVEPATAEGWPARAAAITISTGEGRGRKLTAEGAALFEEMVKAGVRNPEIARTLGMANQSVHTRAKKILASPSPV